MEKKKTIARFRIIVSALAALAGLFGARNAHAATLFFSPQSGTYFTGRSFTVAVKVSSPDQAMSAAQGEISFPTKNLAVLSVSKTDSIMNLWVQDPTFSNHDGVINFGGVAVNPGFKGTDGTIFTVTFEAESPGSAPLSFISGSVLANDGKGTNILSGMQSANFSVIPLAAMPANASAPAVLIISNPPLADGNWYNLDHITFDWSVPSNAEGVDYTISTNANFQLPDVNLGFVSQVTYDLSNFSDGTWYFFVSFKSGNSWSPPAVKIIMLDRTPPRPFVITREDTDETDAQPVFQWVAADDVSGIDHYEARIGNGDWFNPASLESTAASYVLPPQSPTDVRTFTVRAFDRAGNFTDSSIDFRVFPPAVLCKGDGLSCRLLALAVRWEWLIILIFILLVFGTYGFIYRLLRWRKQSRKELQEFKDELQRDLKRVEEKAREAGGGETDLRQSHLLEEKRSLERQIRHIVEDVKEELKRLTDKK
ncbi:MAG: hypothetical protein ABSE18_02000 [Minisyncoccia bacterium]|jgi:Sec-independent protein translocase protein TatA